DRITSLAFSPNGAMLASSSCPKYALADDCERGEIRLWDVLKQQPLGSPYTSEGPGFRTIAFSPDGKLLALGGCGDLSGGSALACYQGQIRLLNVARQRVLGPPISVHRDWVVSLTYSLDGRILASGSRDGT